MEPGGSGPHSQGLLIIDILRRINPIPRIYTYLFKVHSNIAFLSTPSPSGLPVKILKILLPYSILTK